MTELQRFQILSQALAFTSEDFDPFNRDIQKAIEHSPPEEALALATVKLEANRRFYWAVKNG
jgi:nitrate reductase assembly molybdenum cofactor insertion protein NarJ